MTSSFPRWAGDSSTPFVLQLSQDLQARGWQVDVLAPHAPGAALAESLEGVRVERFRYMWPASQETVCYQGSALVNLRKRPLDRFKVPPLVFAQWAAVARRLAARRYDVLHSHWMLPQGFVGMAARPFGPLPHVVTIHGGDLFGLRAAPMRLLKRMVLHRADAVTVNSSYTENAARELAPRLRTLRRIPMGVAIDALDDGVRAHAAELRLRFRRNAGPLVVFVGRFVEEKGPADVIEALARLLPEMPDATALLVGDGPERNALERLAATLGVRGQVVFPGWVQPRELGAWLAAADCFVGPSRRAANGWVEAQGLTFLEAMIAGVPVVATRSGGIPDVVIDGRTGLLVEERSPEQIAAAVRRVLSDAELARGLVSRAREHAMTFSRDASASAFAVLFAELAPRGREELQRG